jgi:hypothetical protein
VRRSRQSSGRIAFTSSDFGLAVKWAPISRVAVREGPNRERSPTDLLHDGAGNRTTISVTDADNREVLEYDGSTGALLRWYRRPAWSVRRRWSCPGRSDRRRRCASVRPAASAPARSTGEGLTAFCCHRARAWPHSWCAANALCSRAPSMPVRKYYFARQRHFPLDAPAQCCGVSLSTLTSRGSAL